MKLKLTIHQAAALFWLLTSSAMFLPLIPLATKPDAGVKAWALVASVTLIIAVAPVALLVPVLRKWFCWTDAFSEKERKLLRLRAFKEFGAEASRASYARRAAPYPLRFAVLLPLHALLTLVLPEPAYLLRLVIDAIGWYSCGVILLQLAVAILAWPRARK